MIRSNLNLLRAQKETTDGRKLPYRVISEETGLSQNVLVRLMNSKFERIETPTLDALCAYFECQVGDLIYYVSGEKSEAGEKPE